MPLSFFFRISKKKCTFRFDDYICHLTKRLTTLEYPSGSKPFYVRPLKNASDCILYAYDLVCDPDGYSEMVFNQYLSDLIGMGIKVPWGKI